MNKTKLPPATLRALEIRRETETTKLIALVTAIAWSRGNTTAEEASAMAYEFILQAREKADTLYRVDKLLDKAE